MGKPSEPDAVATKPLDRGGGTGQLGLLVISRGRAQVFALPAHGEVEVGRGSTATVSIDDESLSRRHAILRLAPTAGGRRTIWVEDLGSQNGTLVRGTKLVPGTPVALNDGDTLELGGVLAILQDVREERAAPAAVAHDELVARVAQSDLSVLVLGETGSGKEVLAERIHRASRRADGPLVRINCAALTATLLESELFGHEKGAFTGATDKKQGLVAAADRGTLFLDEIGEMPIEAQAKLLRVLETREVNAVGAVKPRTVDVRFVAATHRDPAVAITTGRLRQDLYYRLAGITLTVPPLRERRHEIAGLAEQFLEGFGARMGFSVGELTAPALTAIASYGWPGNVRELRNVIERAAVVAGGGAIGVEHLGLGAAPASDNDPERARVLEALAACGGNQTVAAEQLGMSRRTLVYKLSSWGLTKPRRRRS